MQTILFGGKQVSETILAGLVSGVNLLKSDRITPKLVSIMIGEDSGSQLYLSIKRKAAEEIGAEAEIAQFKDGASIDQIIEFINQQNKDQSVHGVMIQLPLPVGYSEEDEAKMIQTISDQKDVDGMKMASRFVTPVVLAIEKAVDEARRELNLEVDDLQMVVLGSGGFVGRRTVNYFTAKGYYVLGRDSKTRQLFKESSKADLLVCATGAPGLIGKDGVKEGSVVIDVGAPKGDVRKEELIGYVAFLSPVPGGIGPVTVACLMENLVLAART